MRQRTKFEITLLPLILIGVILFPIFAPSPYLVHIGILILIWSYVVTVWSYMARFGMVSLCHAAYMGIGFYTTFLLFNFFNVCPWIGMVIGIFLSGILALAIGHSCFRFGVIGHYFAVSTLVIGELITLTIIAFRGPTGGRLGLTVNPVGASSFFRQLYYFQFESKLVYYYIAFILFLFALYVWKKIDQSKIRIGLRAIGDDEVAAASVGIPIVRFKTSVTVISATMATIGGVLYGQYLTYVNPVSMVGVMPSLQICFKAILGGMFTLWGPTIGTILTVSLEEYIRIYYGTAFIGYSHIFYAIIIILLIIFLPQGLYGSLSEIFYKMKRRAVPAS
jgi:branched-chain amino acid transport system permease protein